MTSFMAIVLHSFGQNDFACGPNAEMRHCGKHCEQKCGHLHPKPWKCMCRPLSCGCNPVQSQKLDADKLFPNNQLKIERKIYIS
jgi:hypothetical protein